MFWQNGYKPTNWTSWPALALAKTETLTKCSAGINLSVDMFLSVKPLKKKNRLSRKKKEGTYLLTLTM